MNLPGSCAVAARDSCHMDGSQEAVFQAMRYVMLQMIKRQDLLWQFNIIAMENHYFQWTIPPKNLNFP